MVKTDRGGIRRLAPLLLASLLLHLAILIAVSGSYRGQPAGNLPAAPLLIDYWDSGANREHTPQNTPPRPVATARSVTPPPAQPVTPHGTLPSRMVIEKEAPTALPGQGEPLRDASQDVRSPPIPTAKTGNMEKGSTTTPGGTVSGARPGAGSGGGSISGAGHLDGSGPGGKQGTGASGTQGDSLQRHGAYQALLKRLIETHKEYPFAARRSRREGSCQRRFVLSRTGAVKQVEALSSCGHQLLDEAATRAITTVGIFPPLPDEFRGTEETFTIIITFTLDRG